MSAERPTGQEQKSRRRRPRFFRPLLACTVALSGVACASEVSDDSQLLNPVTTTQGSAAEACETSEDELGGRLDIPIEAEEFQRLLGSEGAAARDAEWSEIDAWVDDWLEEGLPADAEVVIRASAAFQDAPEAQAEQRAGRMALLASQHFSLPAESYAYPAFEDGIVMLHFVPVGDAAPSDDLACKV